MENKNKGVTMLNKQMRDYLLASIIIGVMCGITAVLFVITVNPLLDPLFGMKGLTDTRHKLLMITVASLAMPAIALLQTGAVILLCKMKRRPRISS